jgi:electron transfer flavoprotein beta subunit
LADYLKELAPDIIFFGKQSVDYDDSAVGLMVAEMLGLPSVSVVVKLEVADGKARAEREIEGGCEVAETKLPAVFTAQKGLNEPRYPSLKGIMAAKSKPIEERPASAVQANAETVAMRKPPAKPAGKIVGTDASAVPELVRLLHEEAKVI